MQNSLVGGGGAGPFLARSLIHYYEDDVFGINKIFH